MNISKLTGPVRWFTSASALPRGKKILDAVPSEGFAKPEGAHPGYFYTGASRHFGHNPPKKGNRKRD